MYPHPRINTHTQSHESFELPKLVLALQMKRYSVPFSNTKDFFVFKILGHTDSIFYTQMIPVTQ
jgi:hypothetical protein